ACTSRAAAAAAGSSDGARKARCEVACSCSLARSDRLVCRWRMAVDAMLDGVVRGIIVRFLSSSDEAGAVDEHVQRLIDRGHDAGCGLVGGLVGEQIDGLLVAVDPGDRLLRCGGGDG